MIVDRIDSLAQAIENVNHERAEQFTEIKVSIQRIETNQEHVKKALDDHNAKNDVRFESLGHSIGKLGRDIDSLKTSRTQIRTAIAMGGTALAWLAERVFLGKG